MDLSRRSSRLAKPKSLFSPAVANQRKRIRIESDGPTLLSEPRNKWEKYRCSLRDLLLKLDRDTHFLTTITQDRWGRSGDHNKLEVEEAQCNQKIEATKRDIEKLMKELSDEHKDDRQFGSQYQTTESGGEIDVMTIVCSHCGSGESSDSNDIIFCDRENCDKCYHMNCLTPVVTPIELGDDSDWFCRKCSCASDCLLMLEEFGFNFLHETSVDFSQLNDNADQAVADDDDDDDEDDLPAQPLAGLRNMMRTLDQDLDQVDEKKKKKRKRKKKTKLAKIEEDVAESKEDNVSTDNIIPSNGYSLRRKRNQVDYVALNAMFDVDEDEEKDEEYKG